MLVLSLVRTLLFVAAHGGTIMKAARVGLLVSGLLAAWAMPAHAGNDLLAATCNSNDVQTTMNAAANGDRVLIPDGICTWTTQVTMPVGSEKAVTIRGQHDCTLDAKGRSISCPTVLVDNIPKGNRAASILMLLNTMARKDVRVSHLELRGQALDPNVQNQGTIAVRGGTQTLRIDHVFCNKPSTACFITHDNVIGLIDHNNFDISVDLTGQNKKYPNGIVAFLENYGGTGGYGDLSFASPTGLGSSRALFIEDNLAIGEGLDGTPFVDHAGGSRVVIRRNDIVNEQTGGHGTDSGFRVRGERQYEIYDNTFTNTISPPIVKAIGSRGGTGVIYNNTIGGSVGFKYVVNLAVFRSHGPLWAPYGQCVGAVTVSSITRSGSVATATTVSEHGVVTGAGLNTWITIAGADQAEYNRNFFAVRVSSTQFTFTVVGTPATPATGTITAKTSFDGHQQANGYPCLDQVGRGQGDLLAGNAAAFSPVGWLHQALEPVCIWNNSGWTIGHVNPQDPAWTTLNVDYYVNATTKPSACASYTPYPYPHPLQADTTPPGASTNVRVQ
ncbi:MAG: hypothetical protein E6K65_00245 [Nitrospirae bacterium]|nr:MAG: hypothetical protein E6K65_00245 [Nitrospirota bacterium]